MKAFVHVPPAELPNLPRSKALCAIARQLVVFWVRHERTPLHASVFDAEVATCVEDESCDRLICRHSRRQSHRVRRVGPKTSPDGTPLRQESLQQTGPSHTSCPCRREWRTSVLRHREW